MVTDYKRTGTFLDLTLAFNLLHGFPTMLIQTVFVVLTCGVLSILFEVVMLINVDIKATEESKHLQKKAYVVDVVVCTVYGITILSVMTIPIIFALQFDLSPSMYK
jgi:predicted proteasome-type protease